MMFSVFFARFPYQNAECPDSADWVLKTAIKCKQDPRIGAIFQARFDDTPITMTRNQAALAARKHGADYLVMIDSDMKPDLPGEEPFWETSLEFLLAHRDQPCMIAAPYCGPPNACNTYVFQWANWMNEGARDLDFRLEQFTREEAAVRADWFRAQGKPPIEQVAALPTGLIIIDTRVFDVVKPPWFYYEWKDKTESEKASTEDVTFTRDASLSGCPVYCNWGSWAGHWKRFLVEKPQPIKVEAIQRKFVEAVLRERGLSTAPERHVQVPEGGVPVNNGRVLLPAG